MAAVFNIWYFYLEFIYFFFLVEKPKPRKPFTKSLNNELELIL